MPNDRLILCGSVREQNLPHYKRPPLRLRTWGDGANVTMRIEDVRRRLFTEVPKAFLDLLDIAAYVYTADQATRRSNTLKEGDVDIGEGWRRKLHFRIPVREVDLWRSSPVLETLTDTLSFLSDDTYEFEFEPLSDEAPSLQGYLDFGGSPYEGDVEEVALFSGGLDSLAGAVKESIGERRRVLLLNHQSTPKVARQHSELVSDLIARAADRAPVHLTVRINKDSDLTEEFTQRARSFLYACLGSTVAVMVGRDRLRFYENGVISLNVPPAAQVLGGRATRTTHPKVLQGFARLISEVAGSRFVVENPFLWMTKKDVVQVLVDAGCADLIGKSISCAHTMTRTLEHPHCGECSQCIDRRFAVLAAGQADHDPAEGYACDLVVGARESDDSRAMLAAYVETAREFQSLSADEFFGRFGEISRAIRYLPMPACEAASKIHDLCRRHANDVVSVVRQSVQRNAARIFDRTVPPTSMLAMICGSLTQMQQEFPGVEKPQEAPNFFRREGDTWRVRYHGHSSFTLKDLGGCVYLQCLLSQPGKPVSAMELSQLTSTRAETSEDHGSDTLIDRESLEEYERERRELLGARERAERKGDTVAIASIDADLDAIASHVSGGVGLMGRLRAIADSEEKARMRVTNALSRVLKRIAKHDRAFFEHLQDPTLQFGKHPRYAPATPTYWET